MSKICDLKKGLKPGYGHTVSNSNIKTKRRFLPNLHQHSFFSPTLGVDLKLKVASRTLRTIAKHGGIDAYLLTRMAKDLTPKGLKLKRQIKAKIAESK